MTRLVAVVGPSGAGKDTLMTMACNACSSIRSARRVITRPADAGGEDFEAVTQAEFLRRIDRGDFALHWGAHGLGYGIPAAQLAGTGTVLFNASRSVLAQAVARFPLLMVLVVTAPAPILAARLANRGREDPRDQALRLERAAFELPPGIPFRTVVNDRTADEGLVRFLDALQPVRA